MSVRIEAQLGVGEKIRWPALLRRDLLQNEAGGVWEGFMEHATQGGWSMAWRAAEISIETADLGRAGAGWSVPVEDRGVWVG